MLSIQWHDVDKSDKKSNWQTIQLTMFCLSSNSMLFLSNLIWKEIYKNVFITFNDVPASIFLFLFLLLKLFIHPSSSVYLLIRCSTPIQSTTERITFINDEHVKWMWLLNSIYSISFFCCNFVLLLIDWTTISCISDLISNGSRNGSSRW